jgi:hypothetical protein
MKAKKVVKEMGRGLQQELSGPNSPEMFSKHRPGLELVGYMCDLPNE